MSERKELALRLGELVQTLKMVSPYGGYQQQSIEKGKPHVILFSMPANLDGTILVYGPKFIMMHVVTRYSDFPHKSQRVFESEENAIKFLNLFAEHDFDKALEVPVK